MMEDIHELIPDKTTANLWLWHSIEETEHKAVAYDMYEYLYGKGLDAYIPRIALFTLSIMLVTFISNIYQFVLMSRDKQSLNFNSWLKFTAFAIKKYRKVIPKFMAYYRRDFHPNHTDESDLVALTKRRISLDSITKKLI